MNPRNTFALVLLTAGIFAFIFFVEPHLNPKKAGVPRILPDLKTNTVSAIQVLTPHFEIRAGRTNDTWQLSKPLIYPANNAAVNAFLAALVDLQPKSEITAQELKDHPAVNEEYGFDPPLATVVIQDASDQHQLKLGKFTAPGDGIYAQVVGGSSVLIIDADFYKKFVPPTANEWRDTAFVDLKNVAFDRLIVASGNQAFELQRDSTAQLWRMARPVLTRADTAKVDDLLNKLGSVGVINFVTDETHPDLEGYGLQPAALELKFNQGTNTMVFLQFGKSPATNENLIYARRVGQNSVVLVPRESVLPWQKSYQEFRDRHLVRLPGYLPDMIQVLGQGKELFTVSRGTNNSWRVLPPYDFPADTNLVYNFLGDLTGMEVVRSNSEVAVKDTVLPDADFPRYGLKTPSRSYILTGSGRSTNMIAEVDFGLEEDGKVYARRGDQPDETSVYAVKAADFHKLPVSGLQLHARRIWDFIEDDVVNVTVHQNGASTTVVRKGPTKWYLQEGSREMNELILEMGAQDLGALAAQNWIARGDQDRARYGFTEKAPRLTVEIQIHGKSQTLALDFGGRSPNGLRYGDVKMEDGQNWIFEFPPKVHDELAAYFNIEESPTR